MITTIIFDLSDVYLHGIAGSGKYLQSKIGTNVSDNHLLIDELDRLFLGEISEEKYWRIVIRKNSWNIPIDDLQKAARKNFQEIKGTREIIERLRQNGYKLGLLSNNVKEWVEYCEIKYKYHQLFHEVLYSYQAQLSKPNKDIFLAILKRLKVKPEQCLFIDDYIKNIETAKQLSIETIHFTSAIDLKKKLREFKIKI